MSAKKNIAKRGNDMQERTICPLCESGNTTKNPQESVTVDSTVRVYHFY